MFGTKTKILAGLAGIALVSGVGIVAASAATGTPKTCVRATTGHLYQKAKCYKGDTGPAGAQGPAGDAAGIVRKCANVTVNATYQNRPDAQRQVTLEGLPPYVAS